MKIIVAKHFGICFGVRDAITQAEELARTGSLNILGELVHNPVVRERLRSQGIHETGADGAHGRVMITAHGISDSKHASLLARGLSV